LLFDSLFRSDGSLSALAGEKTLRKISALAMKLLQAIRTEYSFAPEHDPGLERRLFRLICLTISLLVFIVLIPANFFQDLSPMVNVPIAILGVASFAMYRASVRGSHNNKTMLVMLLLTVNSCWFLNGGNDGSVPYFFFPICMYPLIVFRHWKRWATVAGIVANSCLMIVLSYRFPWLVTPYNSSFDRTADLIVGMTVGSLSIILVLWVVLSTYLREQERLKMLNLKLEHEITGRMRTEKDLLKSNTDLAATEEKLRRQLEETIAAQDALLRSEERYGELVEHVNCIILRMTPYGEITFINEYTELFFGYKRNEIIGRNIAGILDPETGAGGMHAPRLQLTGSTSDPYRLNERESVCADGRRAWINWSTKPICNSRGEITEILCVGQDVTERRQLQQQSMQRQKLESIGLLAGGIAHDFNNLLTPIIGAAELIMSCAPHDDPVYRRASTICNAAGKAAELVKQILSFSSKQAIDAKWHDLNEIVGCFMSILRRTIRENIDIRSNLCGGECPVLANRTQIEQILLNLAVNAQDAIAGTGTITIDTGRMTPDSESCDTNAGNGSERFIMLTFGDDGCGIDDSVIGQIFDPFFTTKPAGLGTGLGLSTVYGIVKQHGGHIELESRQGHGTIFRIFLPEAVARENSDVRPLKAELTSPTTAGTVLLVEDNPMVLEIARELLTGQGLTVLAADDPEVAISQARKYHNPIDLLVSDVVMPKMNGPELYRQLLQLQPQIKVLFMSGYTNKVPLSSENSAEDVNFIAKPFSAKSFLESVNQLLTTSA
jgi:PAS domain S-box-containing protein